MSKQVGAKKRYDQKTLQLVVDAIRGNKISIRAAAKSYGIPRSTLFDKVNNRRPMVAPPRLVLTVDEEQRLVDWILHMARIGYGRTRSEVMDTVKKIIDSDGRPNPFTNNKPGKDGWYGFVKRHPEISERLPQQLGKERAIITPERVSKWFVDYEQYVMEEIKDPSLLQEPSRLYNADESGFSMCPKTGKILAKKGSSSVYNFSSSDKTQITVLACMGATGHFLKPLIVYPGQRFSYNPLEGFPEAMMGRTENGWMDTELFSTWLEELFIPEINAKGVKKPVVLFVDGHSTHVSLRVSDICRQNDVELYCLLEHASHLMQPCDLRLFSNLKIAWKKSVRDFQFQNIGEHVNKRSFARVFKEAWEQSTTVTVAVNGFRESGLFPLDASRILRTTKMDPSNIFKTPAQSLPCNPSQTENEVITPEHECDINTGLPANPIEPPKEADIPPNVPETKASSCAAVAHTSLTGSQSENSLISSSTKKDIVTEILQIPTACSSSKKATTKREPIPKAITGDKFREMMAERQRKKDQAEKEKQERKEQRETNRLKKEQEKEKRLKIREEKKKEREELKLKRKNEKRLKELERLEKRKRKNTESSSDESIVMSDLSDSEGCDIMSEGDGSTCSICGEEFDQSPFWISCHNCPRIFHRICIKTIDLCVMTEEEIEDLKFECDFC